MAGGALFTGKWTHYNEEYLHGPSDVAARIRARVTHYSSVPGSKGVVKTLDFPYQNQDSCH